MYIPQLSAESKQILQLIKSHGVCTGRQLAAETGMALEKLVEIIRQLVNYDLVAASGGFYTVKEIGQAYFNIRPSNSDLAEMCLKS
jgi:hypothetical protein